MDNWSPVPFSYVLNGSAFKSAAEAVINTVELDEKGVPKKAIASPVYFLLSHSAELFLKAVLLKQGKSEAFLKKFDYRHNLEALLKELDSINMTVSKQTKQVIHILSEQHSKHVLRYDAFTQDKVQIYWTPLPQTLAALDELMLLSKKPRNVQSTPNK